MATLSPPVSPQQHRGERPRAVSAMSYQSTSSRRSKSSNKLEMIESPRDKKKFNVESKADPTKALSEATPGEIALQDSTLEDVRRTQWKDQEGNVIADPDKSNPSRPRMERPLDTIRSFNAAAEGTSSRRSSSYGGRPMSQYAGSEYGNNRPASYYGSPGYGPRSHGRQTPGGGYYRNNSYGFNAHHQGSFDEAAEYDQRDHYRPAPPRAGPGMRNYPSNPYYGTHPSESPIPAHGHHHSYETMTSGSDENGKSTNPSSLNSSYDQLHMAQAHARKQDAYAQQAYHGQYDNDVNHAPVSPVSPHMAASNSFGSGSMNGGGSPGYYGNGNTNGGGYYPQQSHPAPPPKDYQASGARQPIKLNGPPSAPSTGAANGLSKKADSGKRQSWLSRKFSKKEK